MPLRKQSDSSKARQVGRKSQSAYRELTQAQQIWLGVIASFCLARDTAVFIGTVGTTGSLRLNFYPPDDKCVASLNLREDWNKEVPDILTDIYGEDITVADLLAAAPWAAERAAEAPLATRAVSKSGPA